MPRMKNVVQLTIILLFIGIAVACKKNETLDQTDEQIDLLIVEEENKIEPVSSVTGAYIEMNFGVKLEIPPKAVTKDIQITIETINPTLEENNNYISKDLKGDKLSMVVRCGPEGTRFEIPVKVTIPYYSELLAEDTPIDSIVVVSYSEGSAELLPYEIDKVNQVVIAQTIHFSDLVVMAKKGILVYQKKIYETVIIDGKEWMAENLAYLPSVNTNRDLSQTEPRYYVLDYEGTNDNEAKKTKNYKTFGVLYNWSAAMEACPDGWHLPTTGEWEQLIHYIEEKDGPFNYFESDISDPNFNRLLKAHSTEWRKSGIDKYGFSALPGGNVDGNGTFSSILANWDVASWWTSTIDNTRGDEFAWFYTIYEVEATDEKPDLAVTLFSGTVKRTGASVRYVKD